MIHIDHDRTEVAMAEKLAEVAGMVEEGLSVLIMFEYGNDLGERWVVNFYGKDGQPQEVYGDSMFSALFIALEVAGFPPAPFVEELFKQADIELDTMRKKKS